MRDLQSTEQEDNHQRKLLMSWDLDPPDHRDWKEHDQNIVEGVEGKRGDEEILRVDAGSAGDCAIPIESNRLALEGSSKKGRYEDGNTQDSEAVDSDSKLSVLKRENSHVEEEKGCLDQKNACWIHKICAV